MDSKNIPVIPTALKKRSLITRIQARLDDRKALVLLGSRRSGKTSILLLLLEILRKRRVVEEQIFFFDLENQLVADRLNEIKDFDKFPFFLTSLGANLEKQTYIFLDEVQYLSNPARLIKYLVDHYANLKFIVTGSASILVKSVFSDSMVGRIWRFQVRPLSFKEFLEFRGKSQLLKILKETEQFDFSKKKAQLSFFRSDFEHLFEEFSLFGGYPEVVLTPAAENKKALLSRLYSEYIRKDISHIAEIRETGAYNNLVRLLAGQVGQLTVDSELADSLRISRATVNRFLFLLSETFIIKLLTPYFTNARQEIIKTPKVYFEDTGLANFLLDTFGAFDHYSQKGSVVENCLFNEYLKRGFDPMLHLHFWRTKQKQEVDFVLQKEGKVIPYEIKYQSFAVAKIPLGLSAFIRRYKPAKAFVLTRDFWGERKVNKTQVLFLPVWAA